MTKKLRDQKTVDPKNEAVEIWPKENEEARGNYRVFGVNACHFRSPRSSRLHEFYVISCPDWVNILCLTGSETMVLVRQFRYGTEEISLEIPGGLIDPGESPLNAARRELYEETGFTSENWLDLGYVLPNPALQKNRCYTFLARNAVSSGPPEPDSNEEIEVVLLARTEVSRLVGLGEIRHALVLNAFYALERFERMLTP